MTYHQTDEGLLYASHHDFVKNTSDIRQITNIKTLAAMKFSDAVFDPERETSADIVHLDSYLHFRMDRSELVSILEQMLCNEIINGEHQQRLTELAWELPIRQTEEIALHVALLEYVETHLIERGDLQPEQASLLAESLINGLLEELAPHDFIALVKAQQRNGAA